MPFVMMAIGYTWMALFYWVLILVAVTEQRGVVRFIARIPPLRYLGRISYGVYLVHVPMEALVFALLTGHSGVVRTQTDALAMLLGLLAPIGVAALSWHLMEERLVRYGHTLPYRRR